MARKSASEKLLDLVEQDPRFLLAGPAASMIWLRLVRMMARLGDAQVLRLGFIFGSWAEVAFGLRITETELETHVETLLARGLVERDDASISLPDWMGLRDRRAEAARANGAKGGRPRKNAPDPRQANILLPIEGGAAVAAEPKTQETKTETQSETLSRARLLSPEDQSFEEREEAAVLVLLKELAERGALHPREAGNREAVRSWLGRGATPAGLRDAFMAALRRTKPPRLAPISYFDRLAEDLLADPSQGAQAAAVPAAATKPEDEATAIARAQNCAMWRRYTDVEGRVGPCPPPLDRWLSGNVPNRGDWIRYIDIGRAAFLDAA